MEDLQQPSQLENQQQSESVDSEQLLRTVRATRKERDDAAKRARELEDKLRQLEEANSKYKEVDLAQYSKWQEEAKKQEQRRLEEQQEYQKLHQQKELELQERDKAIAQMQSEMRQYKVDQAIKEAFFDSRGRRGNSQNGASFYDFVLNYARQRIRLDDSGITVLDRKGFVALNEKGQPLTLSDLMTEFSSDPVLGTAFEPINNGAGSGKLPSYGGNYGANARDQLMNIKNRAERLARARDLGIQ